MRFSIALSILCGSAVGLLGLGGCLEPRDAFDDFTKRYEDINGSSGGGGEGGSGGGAACVLPAAGEADGDYLFALAAPDLGGKKAFAIVATLTTTADGDGLVADLTFQPLSKLSETDPIGDPNAATEVGDPLVFTGLPVAADGSFEWDLGKVTLAGAANPISASDIVTTLVLTGELCGADRAGFVCGGVTGVLEQPFAFDLTGGFAMQKLDGATLPPPVINCAKDAAEY